MRLARVLVVESLPVPLHVSLKTLYEAAPSREIAAALLKFTDSDSDNKFKAEAFPEEYRTHPYWTSNVLLLPAVCHMGEEEFQAESSRLEASRGADAVQETLCEYCGATELTLKLCSACKRIRYCSKQCQTTDWKRHKRSCVRR